MTGQVTADEALRDALGLIRSYRGSDLAGINSILGNTDVARVVLSLTKVAVFALSLPASDDVQGFLDECYAELGRPQ